MYKFYRLVCAVATQEGYFVKDSRAQKNNNPGNVTASPLARKKDPRFVIFLDKAEGEADLYWQLMYYALRGYTLRQTISAWAPTVENATDNYLSFVSKVSGISPDEKLKNILEPLVPMIGTSPVA